MKLGLGLFLLLAAAGCVTDDQGIQSPHMSDLKIYSDSEVQKFKPLMTRYNLDPPLGDELFGGTEEDESELFKPHHKFSKMRYLNDDGSITVHYYLEAGTGNLIAALLVSQVKELVKVGPVANPAPNQVTVFPSFIKDVRRTGGVGISGFVNYSNKPRDACDLLVVRADSDKLMDCEDYIARVLTEIPQIEIKVRVIEVRLDDAFEYGVNQLTYKETTGDSFLNTIFETDEDGNYVRDDNGNLIYESGGWTTNFPTESGLIGGDGSFRGSLFHVAGIHDKLVLDALIELVQKTTESQVLSAPKITVLNGHKATIDTGTDVPVQKVVNKTTESTFSYTYQPTGVKMVILPTVLMDDQIQVEIHGEVINISGQQTVESNEGSFQIPIFTTRNFTTAVTVKNGEALAMGGLLARTELERVSKVPLLGDIPILGLLFKSKTKELIKTQIIFYIEPRIVKPEETIYIPD